MPVKHCSSCKTARAVLKRPKTFEQLCRECFYAALENEVHHTITNNNLYKPGERVAIAASGGKDSTVLAHIMTTLNARHGYVDRGGVDRGGVDRGGVDRGGVDGHHQQTTTIPTLLNNHFIRTLEPLPT